MANELENVQGLKELADAMRELPGNIGKNILRGAVNQMATEIKNEALANAPELTGALKANIYQKHVRQRSGQFEQTYIVSVRRGKAKYKKNKKNERLGRAGKEYENAGATFYWRFHELGTSKMPANPFLRPAFELKKRAAVERLKTYIEKRLPKEVAKLRRWFK